MYVVAEAENNNYYRIISTIFKNNFCLQII